jgi:hypothetical protein
MSFFYGGKMFFISLPNGDLPNLYKGGSLSVRINGQAQTLTHEEPDCLCWTDAEGKHTKRILSVSKGDKLTSFSCGDEGAEYEDDGVMICETPASIKRRLG